MKVRHLVLTVPHSVALSSEPLLRTRDLVALDFAQILFHLLEANKKVLRLENIFLIPSKNNRLSLDDNRFQNSDTHLTIKGDSKLWTDLRQRIRTLTKKDQTWEHIMIWDIHSFPNNTPSFHHRDLNLLDNIPYQETTISLLDLLQTHQIKSSILTAKTGSNSILDVFTLHPLYIPTLLIEINEKFLSRTDKLNELADLLIDFLSNINFA